MTRTDTVRAAPAPTAAERRRRGAVVAAALALLTPIAAGCAPTPAELPAGVRVDLYQTRLDVADGTVEIAVENGSDAPITVTAATLASEQFADDAVWAARPEGTRIPAGATIDLPVALPAQRCATDAAAHRVRIEATTADGRHVAAVIEAADRYGQLADLRARACTSAALHGVLDLAIDTPPTLGEIAGARVAVLPITVTPTGGDADATILAIHSTVLLDLADPETGAALTERRIDRTIRGDDEPTVIELPVRPTRCDPHAIAEDKQGTLFTVDVLLPDGETAAIVLPASEATKIALYDAVTAICAG